MSQTAEIRLNFLNGQQVGKTINELTAQSVKLNREIKKMEVGSEEFVEATQEYQKVNNKLKETQREVRGVTTAQRDLNSSMTEFMPFSSQINRFVGGFKNLSTAIKGSTISTRAFGIALAATGIGLIVLALGQLVSMFLKTQEGMDIVTRYTRPLVAIFQNLKGLAQELGGSIFKGLAQILKGDVAEGFRTLSGGIKDAVSNFGDVVVEGAKAGAEIDRLTKQIEIKQNEMILTQSRLNRQIAEQTEISRDLSKSETERNAAAQKAIDLINERTKEEDNLLAMQIRKLEIEQSLNDTDREGMAEMNRLIAQREDLQASAAKERVRLNNVVNQTANKGEQDVTKVHGDELKKKLKAEEEYAKTVAEASANLTKLKISLIEDETERSIASLRNSYETDLANFKGSEDQKAEYAILRKQQLDNDLAKASKEAMARELAGINEDEEVRRLRIEENFYAFLLSEDQREQALYNLKMEKMYERLELIKAIHGEESAEYQKQFTDIAALEREQHDKRIQDAKNFAEAKKALEHASLDTFRGVIGLTAQLLSEDEEARKKNFNALKALKIAEIMTTLPVELQNIWKNANLLPVPFNTIVGAAQSALAVVRHGASLSQLKATKYAQGGLVNGPSHAMGGIPFGVKGSNVRHEMEGGEVILSKGVSRDPMLYAAASMINQLGGGRSFEMGGPVVPQSPQQVINNVINNSSNEDTDKLVREIAALRSDVANWQSQFEVKLSLQKIKKAEGEMKEVEMDTYI